MSDACMEPPSVIGEDGPHIYARFRFGLADLPRNQDFDFALCKAALARESSIGFCPVASFRLALVASSRAIVREISDTASLPLSSAGSRSGISQMANSHWNRKIQLRLPAESIMRRRRRFLLSTYIPGLSFSIPSSGSRCIDAPSVAYLYIFMFRRVGASHLSRYLLTIRRVVRNSAIKPSMTTSRRGVSPSSRDSMRA